MTFLKSFIAKLGQVLVLYGGWGLLGISFLDSSFVPLPGLNDFVLIHLSAQNPSRAAIYAIASTLGSLAGCFVMYGLARGGAKLFVKRQSSPAAQRARQWLARNDFVSLLVASLLPPPSPFKLFLLVAGAARLNPVRFGLALAVGRGLRFGAAALLGARYGLQAEAYLKQNVFWASLVLVCLVVAWTMVYRRLVGRDISRPPSPESGA